MKILVCLDDTDNLESRGTGELADILANDLEARGWGRSMFITRHQLLVHPDIPYTSHNSSMCFAADLEYPLEEFIAHAQSFLEAEAAPGSDPGLCVSVPDRLPDASTLIAFGESAKTRVLNKAAAWKLAADLQIHLSEHGGSGDGIIGALAGVGLRLGGNDGRLKGRLQLGEPGTLLSVAQLLRHPWVEEVATREGTVPPGDTLVRLNDKVKTVLLRGRSVLLLAPLEGAGAGASWQTCTRQQLSDF